MKKTILLLGIMAAAIATQARSLSPNEALARVKSDVTAAKAPAVKAVADSQPKLIRTTTTEAGMPAVYLFENTADRRMLFVAADDVATPLLGYSDMPVAECAALPPQLEWWLSEYARQIAYAQLNGTTSDDTKTAPGALVMHSDGTRRPIEPMITTEWNQTPPYNFDCPIIGSQLTVTGCVATAMAQLMNYFEWPEKGTGIAQATCNGEKISLDLSTITFDWANMRDTYNEKEYTETERDAVSQLMKACGYSVKMDYGTGASGASSYNVPSALINNFNYDMGIHLADRSFYSRKDWESLVYNNLANIGPLYYSGRSTDGGHAFVCDGYSSDGFFHFNWGWGGMYNGYFSLQALNPDGQGVGGFAGGYNFLQDVIIGIQRPTGTTAEAIPQLRNSGLSGQINNEGELCFYGEFVNNNSSTICVDLYGKFVPVDGGEPIRQILINNGNLPSYSGYSWFSLPPSQFNISDGSYEVYVETTAHGKTDRYYPLIIPHGKPDHFILTKSGSTFSVSNLNAETANISITELFSEVYYASSMSKIAVNPQVGYTIQNNTDHETLGGVAFQIASGTNVIAYSTGNFYDLMPDESITEKVQLQLQLLIVPTLGVSYDLYVYDPEVNADPTKLSTSQKISTVTFKEYPGVTLVGSGLKVVGNKEAVDLSAISIEGTVECTAGVFGGMLQAYIYTKEPMVYETHSSIAAINLKENESTGYSSTIYPTLPLQADTDYILQVECLIIANDYNTWLVLQQIDFHTTALTGIDDLTANGAESISIAAEGLARKATVTSPSAISNVTIVSISGAEAYAPVSYQGTSADVALEGLPAGIYVIRATDAAGNSATSKIALR